MIEVVHEHSVDLSLLPDEAYILDIGARGTLFCDHFKALGHYVVSVDADNIQGISHPNLAITNFIGLAVIVPSNDPQATRIIPYKSGGPSARIVEAVTLGAFCRQVGIAFWDLIKIDIEGSEYEVIMSLKEAPAKQLSIEFHLHTGIYGDAQMKEMEDKLLALGYFPVKHDKYPAHGLPPNYWDSLFILK